MAKRTNKTDHLLNLLAGGESQAEDKQSPEELKESGRVDGSDSQEAVLTAEPEEAMVAQEQMIKDAADSGASKDVSDSAIPVKATAVDTKITAGNVHVVRAIGSEDPIAELIREDLEKELEAIPSTAGTKSPKETFEPQQNKTGKEIAGLQQNEVVEEFAELQQNEAVGEIAELRQEEAAEEIAELRQDEAVEEIVEPQQNGAVDEIVEQKQDETAEKIAEPKENEAAEEIEEAQQSLPSGESTGATEPTDRVLEPEVAAQADSKDGQTVTDNGNEKESSSMAKTAAMAEEAALRIIRDGEDADQMHGHVFFNMMEKIVWEKAPEFMNKFGVCTCSRCKADTIALALSKLPPKYVVAEETAISPLLSFYEDHYAGQITVEITKACIAVSANPRHKKK